MADKVVQKKLRESEERYRTLVANANEGIYIRKIDGTITYANEKFAEIHGHPLEKIIGRKSWDFLYSDTKKRTKERDILKEMSEGKVKREEAKIYTRAGKVKFVDISNTPMKEKGKLKYIFGIVMDITERKKTEEKIEQLHKTAAKMETVKSEEEICQLTVDAAEKILEFNVCGIDLVENEKFVAKAVSSNLGPDGYVSRPISEGGVDSKTYLNKKSYLTKNIRTSRDSKPVKTDYRSGISVPVGEIGIFQAISTQVNNFDEKDLKMAELLISHTAEALKRIRSGKELRKSKEKIERLHEITQQLEKCKSEDNIYQITVKTAENILDFDTVVMFTRKGNTLVVTSRSTSLPDDEGADMNLDEGIAGKTYQARRSYLVGDVRKEGVAHPSSDKYRSTISIPIGNFGVFQAISTEINSFDQEDLKMGELLVSHAREAISRVRDERALRESEKRYRTLFENVPIGIYQTTPEGQIVDANPALIRMFGYPNRESFLSLKASDLFADPERRKKQQTLLREKKLLRDFESQMHRYDGTIIWTRDNSRVVRDSKKDVLFYEGTLEDITERKKAEEEAEFYNSLLRHDISNKNQIITGNMELLEKTDLAKNQMLFVKNALQTVRNGNELIRKIKDLERLKEKPKLRDISLDSVMQKVIRDFSPYTTPREIKIRYHPVKMKIMANSLLEDVLSNLIQNAIVHSECSTLSISVNYEEPFCTITVEDDGKGIPDEDKERIFQRTFKGKESRGSGIGLYLVKMIVKSYNGRVEAVNRVKGEYTEGTRFNVFIPCTP
ncbi:MAG: PAS domain S-box protein [Euryarchaeota archaeon]|nr:PAS domain S-box protein [Euryarchaeota archaeon]